MDKVRLGYIGCGGMSTRMHYPSIVKTPQIDLVAVCDMKEDLAKHHQRAYGALRSYTDVQQMLASEDLDAAVVVGPPQMHTELAPMVLEQGLHLFTEKPIAVTLEDGKRLVGLAEKSGKFTQVGHMMRHATPIRIAKELMAKPEFGKPTFIESKYFTGPSCGAWGLDDARWCYMLVQAIHPIDLARHLGGDIVRLGATACHRENNQGAYAVCVEFADGTAGWINLNGSFPGWNSGVEITGDGGAFIGIDNMARLRYLAPADKQWLTRDEKNGIGMSPAVWESAQADSGEIRMGYQNQWKHFAESILTNTPPYPSFRDAFKAMLVCRAILDSVERGEMVDVPQDL